MNVSSAPDHMDQLMLDLLEAISLAHEENLASFSPIGNRFDPEALERFLRSTTVPASVQVEMYECVVEIDDDRNVRVIDGPDNY